MGRIFLGLPFFILDLFYILVKTKSTYMTTDLIINPVMNNGEIRPISVKIKFTMKQSQPNIIAWDFNQFGLSYDDVLNVEEYCQNNQDVLALMILKEFYE